MSTTPRAPHWLTAILAGWAALVVVHGLGRFVFTPMIPVMHEQTGLSVETAGLLASINLLAYLLGSLFTFWKHQPAQRRHWLIAGLAINAITTPMLALSDSLWWWFPLRFVNGFGNGLVFVYAPLLVMEALSRHQRMGWAGASFTGVGVGMVLGSLIIMASDSWAWQTLWAIFGLIAVPLAIWSSTVLVRIPPAEHAPELHGHSKAPGFGWLGASYVCAGFGYIISMTFLPTIAASVPALAAYAQMSWLFVGLAVAPSPLLWSWLGHRFGDMALLRTNLMLQALGAAMPAIAPNLWGVLIGGALVGGTFVGAVQLTMRYTRHHWPLDAGRRIGMLVTIYAVAQMAAPIIASGIYALTGDFGSSLYLAGAVLVLGGLFTLPIQRAAATPLSSLRRQPCHTST